LAEIQYGHVEGPGKGREYKVTKDCYIHRLGGKFVRLAKGVATLCATGNKMVTGWAVPHKYAEGKNAWKSSSTWRKDSIFVITGLDDVYELPCDETIASLKNLNATYLGKGAHLTLGAGTTTATYGTLQKAKIGSANLNASPVYIVGYSVENHTVQVKIKPGNKQGGAL